ncbi:MAG: hypothetical protein ACFNX7_04020 [Capnocytophaga gingivalis]
MKKTTIINYGVGALIALTGLTSCGGVYTGMGYDDGIYGDKAPRPSYERDDYERAPRTYREQLNQKIAEYKDFEHQAQRLSPSYTPLTNVDGYRTDSSSQTPTYNSYGSWGENARLSQVNVYNYSGWGSPYYWGSGAWGGYYSSSYYPRSGWSWGISLGSYDPYWSWRYYDSYYYPYYYGYNYYYYPSYRYNRENNYYYYQDPYGNTSRKYSPTNGRRGDSSRYDNSSYQNNGTYRSYGNYNNNSYDNSSRSYEDNRTRSYDSSSRSYNNSNYNNSYDNSSRSYDNSSRSYQSSGNGNNSGEFQGSRKDF